MRMLKCTDKSWNLQLSSNKYINEILGGKLGRLFPHWIHYFLMILTKIQVGAIFHMRDIRRNVLPKFIGALYGDTLLLHCSDLTEQ